MISSYQFYVRMPINTWNWKGCEEWNAWSDPRWQNEWKALNKLFNNSRVASRSVIEWRMTNDKWQNNSIFICVFLEKKTVTKHTIHFSSSACFWLLLKIKKQIVESNFIKSCLKKFAYLLFDGLCNCEFRLRIGW